MVWIEWTEAGRSVLQKGRELRIQTLEAQIRALPAADRRSLKRALAILASLGYS